jgi:hypothetical protein
VSTTAPSGIVIRASLNGRENDQSLIVQAA